MHRSIKAMTCLLRLIKSAVAYDPRHRIASYQQAKKEKN